MEKIEPRLFDELKKALVSFGDKYFIGDELNRSQISNDLRAYNEDLLSKLFEIDFIKKNYLKNVAGQYLFQIDQLEEAILYDDYWDTSYTKYENRVGLTSNGKFIKDNQDVVLDFPFKDCVLTASMTKEDSKNGYDDAFLNEVIEKDEIDRLFDKKILINSKKYDRNGEKDINSFNIEKDNLIIKGNNLVALHTLSNLYVRKVKLIYLDPPYFFNNKQEDKVFPYNSNFRLSTWLVFLKNRFSVALGMLEDGGFFVVQMNDYGVFHLKILLDEIFANTNGGFVNDVIVKMSDLSGPKMSHVSKKIPKIKEHILIYTNDYLKATLNPIRIKGSWDNSITNKRYTSFVNKRGSNDPKEWEYTTVKAHLSKIGIEYGSEKATNYLLQHADCVFRTATNSTLSKMAKKEKFNPKVFTKVKTTSGLTKFVYKNEEVLFANSKLRNVNGELMPTEPISDVWDDIALNDLSNEGGINFSNGEKPERLLKRIIELTTNKNDLILDFFMGSATTQAVALKLGRRFIGLEQMDYVHNVSIKRLLNVIGGDSRGISKEVKWRGGGTFVYAELMPKNMSYLQDLISAKTFDEMHEIYKRMLSGIGESQEAADISFKADLHKIEWDTDKVKFEDQKRLLIKLLDKNDLYYNYSEIDDKNVQKLLSNSDYQFNKSFYEAGE